MIAFESETTGESLIYPGKVLALYKDANGSLQAIVHSVEYKMAKEVESAFGDTRLIRHY